MLQPTIYIYDNHQSGHTSFLLRMPYGWLQRARYPRLCLTWWILKLIGRVWRKL